MANFRDELTVHRWRMKIGGIEGCLIFPSRVNFSENIRLILQTSCAIISLNQLGGTSTSTAAISIRLQYGRK